MRAIVVELTLRDAARMAIESQKVNKVATVTAEFAKAALVVQREIPGRDANTHPIITMFLWRLTNLNQFDGSVSDSARRVMEIAKGEG